MDMQIEDAPFGTVCFHVHHDRCAEVLTLPGALRVEFVRKFKDPEEIPIRLERMRPVRGELPEEVVAAARAYADVRTNAASAREAWMACDAAIQRNMAAIEQLHAEECLNCPWDGETLFPDTQER